ncbi:MAG TPA: cupin domain-containing protein [Solirubrobacteraceae bacterium]|jgi:uncharacterized cupin superfamily protein|nr:cupin domain-containing protein [Solirubrobacteraceae bacterium]
MPCHLDDVPWTAYAHGDLHMQRQRLGAAAGARGVGLSRYRIVPRSRAMPLHVHADEEEIFWVLAGSGFSWQDDALHEVRAGDVVVHRASEEAHTLLAGDETLDVLAFASGSPTGLTQLPRAGVTWVGTRWLPSDAPHPLDAEPAAPAAELPAIVPRPPTIVALEDVESAPLHRGRDMGRVRRDLGRAAGSLRSGLQHVTMKSGARSSARHCHSVEEELFVVLDGDGVLLLGDDEHPVSAGSVVARSPATGVAHALQAGEHGMTLLAYGTREPSDMCWYPDSSKILFGGLGVIARVQALDYWDGEP